MELTAITYKNKSGTIHTYEEINKFKVVSDINYMINEAACFDELVRENSEERFPKFKYAGIDEDTGRKAYLLEFWVSDLEYSKYVVELHQLKTKKNTYKVYAINEDPRDMSLGDPI